jgi:hypothetical protein
MVVLNFDHFITFIKLYRLWSTAMTFAIWCILATCVDCGAVEGTDTGWRATPDNSNWTPRESTVFYCLYEHNQIDSDWPWWTRIYATIYTYHLAKYFSHHKSQNATTRTVMRPLSENTTGRRGLQIFISPHGTKNTYRTRVMARESKREKKKKDKT